MATAAMINMLTVGTRLTTIGDQVLSTPVTRDILIMLL